MGLYHISQESDLQFNKISSAHKIDPWIGASSVPTFKLETDDLVPVLLGDFQRPSSIFVDKPATSCQLGWSIR